MNYQDITIKGLALTAENDGATLLKNGEEATKGYAVGGLKEFKIPYYDDKDESTLFEIAGSCILSILHLDCDAYGFWLDGNVLYIDAVTIFQDAPRALAFAAENDELAIFCLHTQDEIRL